MKSAKVFESEDDAASACWELRDAASERWKFSTRRVEGGFVVDARLGWEDDPQPLTEDEYSAMRRGEYVGPGR